MTYWRVYGPNRLKAGVIAVPPEVVGQRSRQTLYLPNSRGFAALWVKAKDRPVVLDSPEK